MSPEGASSQGLDIPMDAHTCLTLLPSREDRKVQSRCALLSGHSPISSVIFPLYYASFNGRLLAMYPSLPPVPNHQAHTRTLVPFSVPRRSPQNELDPLPGKEHSRAKPTHAKPEAATALNNVARRQPESCLPCPGPLTRPMTSTSPMVMSTLSHISRR